MTLVVVSTVQSAPEAFVLATGDDLLITRTGAVIGTDGAIVQIRGASDLIIEGILAGGQVDLEGSTPRVTVGATGSVFTNVIEVSAFRVFGDAVFDNAGQISASGGSGLQTFGFLSSLNLVNGGRLTARDAAVFFQFGEGGTVRNTGTIDGGSYGVYLESGSAEVTNTGTISGGQFGVLLLSGDNTVSNQGTISGDTGVSIGTGFGTDLLLANAGRIAGVAHGVWLQGGFGARIENDGVISGAIGIRLGTAASFNSASNVVVVNSGTIQSGGVALDVFGASPMLVNTGTMGAARMGAQRAVVENGGTIAGGVSFGGNTTGSGTNTLTNTGLITAGALTESSTTAIAGSASAEILINTGTVNGAIELEGDQDLYDGSLGVVTGLVEGDGGNDTLLGGALAESLSGGAGSDLLSGGGGDDHLQTGSGLTTDRDTIDGGLGNDILLGGTGLDLLAGGEGNDIVFGGDNADTLEGDGGRDQLYGQAGADVLDGGEGHDLLQGDAGADSLSGGGGNDVINGNADADTIDGGEGNDVIRPGAGIDEVDGGAGRDRLDYIGSLTVVVNLETGAAFGGDATGDIFSGIEDLSGSNFSDILTGDAGANALLGQLGNDRLLGGSGNDLLVGGGGNDTLQGGLGVDLLRGGLNADVFVFASASETGAPGVSRDRILDFSRAELDRIDVSLIDANAAALGDQAFTYIGNATVFGGTAQLRSQLLNGETFIFGNTDGVTTTAEFSIRLSGTIAFASTDFIL